METYIPTTLFVATSFISFLIPPEVVPGRMALLVTILLVLVNIFLGVSDEVPNTSGLSCITVWIITTIIIV